MGKLDGKVALITGGSSGIGLATAKLLLSEGARVIVTGRDSARLSGVQQELGSGVLVVRSYASNLDDIESLMAIVKRSFGRLDVLFVNAGVAKFGDEIMGINVKGVFFTSQKPLPMFGDNASIIVTTSIANRVGSPNFSVYGASKAALRSIVQSLGLELIGPGIRINAISTGPIVTPIFDSFGLPDEIARGVKEDIARKSPSRRFGTPEEAAKSVLFLASDDSSHMVGEEIVVDGGISLVCPP